ncbi:MAG: hypothetical protein ACK41G_05680 [Candidatus Thermochlorobacter sp.]
MYSEQKWEASEAKTRFAKSFPGLETDADLARSKTPQATFRLPSNGVKLILYTDNTFCFEPLDLNDVPLLLTALRESRPYLSALYPDAFQRLDELSARDAELSRLSKMEKLLGAIVNNSLEIPALYHLVQKQLEDVSTLPQHTLTGKDKIKAERVLNAIRSLIVTTPELYEEIPKVLSGTSTLIQCDMMKSLQRNLADASQR